MSALGSLVVSLTAETAQFRSAMEKAAYQSQKSFGSIQRDARTLVGALAGYFSASIFVSWIKGAIDAADALYDLSRQTGVATDTLSKLQYAAKLSDVSTEEFSQNLVKFNRSIAEAARGTGEAQKAFLAMGISVKDASGRIKSTEVILGDVAEKFSTYADGANKTALATAIFGRAGAGMINFLSNGRQGLTEMGKELERLGGVVMPDAARRANEFNDNLERIKTTSSSVAREIGDILIPYLNDLGNQFLLARKHGLQFVDMLQLGLTSPFGNVQKEIRSIDRALADLSAQGAQDSVYAQSLKRQAAYLREFAQLEALSRATGDFSDQISRRFGSTEPAASASGNLQTPALVNPSKSPQASDEVIRLLERQALAVQKLTLSEEELSVAEVFLAGASIQQVEASQRLADSLLRQTQVQKDLKDQTDRALDLYAEYKALYEETASPVQRLADEEARLLALRERLVANGYEAAAIEKMIAQARMDAADRLFPVAARDELDELRQIAQQFGSAIGTAFEDAVIKGQGLRDVIKGLEQDILRIALRTLVTKPLEGAIEGLIGSTLASPTGFLSGVFGGARAGGGPVRTGQAYLVGEQGPELFIPRGAPGVILPNSAVSNPTVININVSGVSNAEELRRSAGQVAGMAALALTRGQRNL
jgi:hypothetical protein